MCPAHSWCSVSAGGERESCGQKRQSWILISRSMWHGVDTILIAGNLQRTSLMFLKGFSIIPLMYQKDYICLEFYSQTPAFFMIYWRTHCGRHVPPSASGEKRWQRKVLIKSIFFVQNKLHTQAVYNPNLIFILIFLMRVHPLCRFPLAIHQALGSELQIPKWALITSQEYSLRRTPSRVT